MTAVTEAGPRIATLDILRGVAVMGILAMNIVSFAMPIQAYMNPLAYGLDGKADLASWVFSFIMIDGKMRGLFSFLFGASILLVIDRAQASGQNAGSLHFRRMGWLLVFGLLHFYFIWFGDILSLYAMVGMIAWLFRDKGPRALLFLAIGFLLLHFLLFAATSAGFHMMQAAATSPGASAEAVRQWQIMSRDFGVPTGELLQQDLSRYRGSFWGIAEHQLTDKLFMPLTAFLLYAAETLAYMLLGMAALKNGFLGGTWDVRRYRKIAALGLGIGLPVYAVLAFLLIRNGFTPVGLFDFWMLATVPIRPLMIIGTAALIILLTRRGGALVDRIASAGRAAFTNYLGTSILMVTFFYGYGLGMYGRFSRIELWLVVFAMWALMLVWSKPWLDRYRYGPFEWLWRSLSRSELQPMRKKLASA